MNRPLPNYQDREILAHNLILMRKRSTGGLINTIATQSQIINPKFKKQVAPLAYDPFSGYFLEFFNGGPSNGQRNEFAIAVLNISFNKKGRYAIDSFLGDNSFNHTPKAIRNITETIDLYNFFHSSPKANYFFEDELS